MNDLRTRELLRRALEAVEAVANDYQGELNAMVCAETTPAAGLLLRLGRTVDSLEACASQLARILDHPPRLGSYRSARPGVDAGGRHEQVAG